jgi:hypothetical protein
MNQISPSIDAKGEWVVGESRVERVGIIFKED